MEGIGSVDMFGLDDFGNIVWGPGSVVGAATGALLQSGGAVAWRHLLPAQRKWSEPVGALTAAVAGGVMALFGKTRGAGVMAIGTGVASALPRFVDDLVSDDAKAINWMSALATTNKMTLKQYLNALLTTAQKAQLTATDAAGAITNVKNPYADIMNLKGLSGVQLQQRKGLSGVQLQQRRGLQGAAPQAQSLPAALRRSAPIPITSASYGATAGPL
jgi:hypothetical protein